jgi:hypothetical protein
MLRVEIKRHVAGPAIDQPGWQVTAILAAPRPTSLRSSTASRRTFVIAWPRRCHSRIRRIRSVGVIRDIVETFVRERPGLLPVLRIEIINGDAPPAIVRQIINGCAVLRLRGREA